MNIKQIYTVYFSKAESSVELTMHFTKEEDAKTFKIKAQAKGLIAYYLCEIVYEKIEAWMPEYLNEDII